eukprot:Skav207480  [mRNA]  locus=scaffold5111:82376:85855:+ [translate_table: standard]
MPIERALLYLRCLQRLVLHPNSRRWAMSEQGRFFQNDIPLLVLSLCKVFPGSLPMLTLLLPVGKPSSEARPARLKCSWYCEARTKLSL